MQTDGKMFLLWRSHSLWPLHGYFITVFHSLSVNNPHILDKKSIMCVKDPSLLKDISAYKYQVAFFKICLSQGRLKSERHHHTLREGLRCYRRSTLEHQQPQNLNEQPLFETASNQCPSRLASLAFHYRLYLHAGNI